MQWPYDLDDFNRSVVQIVFYRAFLMDESFPLHRVVIPGSHIPFHPTHILMNRAHDYGLVKVWHDANVPLQRDVENLLRVRQWFPGAHIFFYGVLMAHKPLIRKSKFQLCERKFHAEKFQQAERVAVRAVNWILLHHSNRISHRTLPPAYFVTLDFMTRHLRNAQKFSRKGDGWHFLGDPMFAMARALLRHLSHSVHRPQTSAILDRPEPLSIYSAGGEEPHCTVASRRLYFSQLVTCKPRIADVRALSQLVERASVGMLFTAMTVDEALQCIAQRGVGGSRCRRKEATHNVDNHGTLWMDPTPATCGSVFSAVSSVVGSIAEWFSTGVPLSVPGKIRDTVAKCFEVISAMNPEQVYQIFLMMREYFLFGCKSDLAYLLRFMQPPLRGQCVALIAARTPSLRPWYDYVARLSEPLRTKMFESREAVSIVLDCDEQRCYDDREMRREIFLPIFGARNTGDTTSCVVYAAHVGRPGSDFSLGLRKLVYNICGTLLHGSGRLVNDSSRVFKSKEALREFLWRLSKSSR
jgi:hypothetical protein